MIRFILNEKVVATDLPTGKVLLDFIRYHQHLVGTKLGCREGDCGACVVLVGEVKEGKLCYQSMTSCLVPLGNVHGKHVVTIEGLNFTKGLNVVQQLMAEEGATQCGFCTPGFVVSLAGFCLSDKKITPENAIAAIDGNICRCTGYKSIERAATRLTDLLKEKTGDSALYAVHQKILPEYFSSIKNRLQTLENGLLKPWHSSFDTVVAGGTDLYVQRHDELAHTESRLIFNDNQLKSIRKEGSKLLIGAAVTVTDLLESSIIQNLFPNFPAYAKLVSSTPIRNMATVAGNFINASPIGDLTIFFLALNANLKFIQQSSTNQVGFRTLPLRQLYRGYKQLDKRPDEIVDTIWVELPEKNSFFNFEKVSKRTNLDIATVNTAIYLSFEDHRITGAGLAAGGVAPVPLYLQKTSEYLIGKRITDALIDESVSIMQTEISPISDARGSKEYKTVLAGQLIRAHFMKAMQESSNELH